MGAVWQSPICASYAEIALRARASAHRNNNVFDREVTASEQDIIAQRVAAQRKMFAEVRQPLRLERMRNDSHLSQTPCLPYPV